jgi:hypothetical protein
MDAGRIFAMRFKLRQYRRLLAISGAMALLGATVGVAVGTSGLIGPDRVIHGCYNSDGNLRVISPSEKCPKGWAAIEWNQQGIQGATGATGATGAAGPVGAPGPAGPQGVKGDIGPIGPTGLKGDTGATGPAGADGATGPAGPQGPAGKDGSNGADGTTGATGLQGPQGDTGATGPAGADGLDGAPGTAGAKGDKGDSGSVLSSLSDLNGIACSVGSSAGTVRVTVASTGSIAVTCAPDTGKQLTVIVVGSGTVTSAPGGIDCGSTCSADFTADSLVTLTAVPAAGTHVKSWEGCTPSGAAMLSCELPMTGATSVTVTFSAVYDLVLTVSAAPTCTLWLNGGCIMMGPALYHVTIQGTEYSVSTRDPVTTIPFAAGSTVILVAEQAFGPWYLYWGAPCSATPGLTCTLIMDADKSMEAYWTP